MQITYFVRIPSFIMQIFYVLGFWINVFTATVLKCKHTLLEERGIERLDPNEMDLYIPNIHIKKCVPSIIKAANERGNR